MTIVKREIDMIKACNTETNLKIIMYGLYT